MASKTQEQTEISELQRQRRVDPDVTRHILAEWEAEGWPDIWPYELYNAARDEWVEFDSPEALKAATVGD
ncbi:MAG: hypothetical protein H6633_25760 [Anaerolineales bacterium]|nr:hypothetical protein [Anaerolineales bacterium]